MMMTDDEIRKNWRNSAKTKVQIGNLADLNGVPVKYMEQVLIDLGLISPDADVPTSKKTTRKKSAEKQAPCMVTQTWAGVPGNIIRELWDKDLADSEIQTELEKAGYTISQSSVTRWRSDNGLPPHGSLGTKPKPMQEPHPSAASGDPLPLTQLVAILMRISEEYPDTTVYGFTAPVSGVNVLTSYTDKGQHVEVRLI